MAMQIRRDEGHYFQYVATVGNAPSLTVKDGEIYYWIQQGPANGDGSLLVSKEPVIAGQSTALPAPVQEGIFTLFVRTKEFRSEYEFRRGGVSISSVMKKELAGLPTGTVEKSFGKFQHRSESFYD